MGKHPVQIGCQRFLQRRRVRGMTGGIVHLEGQRRREPDGTDAHIHEKLSGMESGNVQRHVRFLPHRQGRGAPFHQVDQRHFIPRQKAADPHPVGGGGAEELDLSRSLPGQRPGQGVQHIFLVDGAAVRFAAYRTQDQKRILKAQAQVTKGFAQIGVRGEALPCGIGQGGIRVPAQPHPQIGL